MTDAPERIWARPEHEDENSYGGFWIKEPTEAGATEYIRADLSQAAVDALEAKLAKAADVLDWALIAWDEHWVHGLNMQGDWVHDARATLAELTGGKNDL